MKSIPHFHNRRAFVLPAVMVCLVLVALLAAALQSAALRADVQARLGFAGEHALHAADAAIAQRLDDWNARDFATMPIGARDITHHTDTPRLTANVALVRTSGTTAWIEADVVNVQDGNRFPAHRRIARFVHLRSPALPLDAALTSLGALRLDDPSSTSGHDQPPAGWTTDCDGIDVGVDVPALSSTAFTGAPPVNARTLPDSLSARALFDSNWNAWRDRAAFIDHASGPVSLVPDGASGHCAPGTGDPLRDASATAACTREWGARVIQRAGPITLTGNQRFQGVLLIDGDLVIDGDVRVDGLLLIRGALESSTGRLTVNGSLLIRDDAGHGSRIGIASRIQYSHCAMQRALAATGIPSVNAPRSWFERP